ncbi:MAG: type II secretion system protein GspD [Desulfuromonas sp.]|nr:MAG: type II secretion system protein GspD [Desulfuromonas sp.]
MKSTSFHMEAQRRLNMTYRVLRIFVLACLVWGIASSALAAEPQAEGIAIDFRDVELTDLIQTISEMTGKNFIYDDTLKGKVSIISPERMSPDEAYEAFLSVLSVKGFTLVPTGRTNKIVPIRIAKESNLPTGTTVPSGEQYVTQLIRMKYVDAGDLATAVLKDLVPKTSHVAAYGPSNTLIITDNAANIERLVQIIRQLDVPTTLEQIEIIPLQYAGAEELTDIITQLLSRGAVTPAARGRRAAQAAQAGDSETTRVIPYPRTNALIVIAAKGELQTIRSLVEQLDQSPPDDRSYINVYYLENADATSLAGTLNEILTGISQKARQERTAQNTQQPVNLKQVTITADKPTNSLVINARPEEFEIIKSIVSKLDIKRKQVFVEALIMELSLDATKNLGISIVGAGANRDGDGGIIGGSNLNSNPTTNAVNLTDFQDDGSGIPSVLGKAVNGLMAGGFLNPTTITGPDGIDITVPALSVLIDLSQSDGDVNILAAPRLLTSDNEEAEIIIGSNIPVITERLTDTGGSGGLAQSVSIERQDAALTLRFTPQVTEGDEVRLNIHQEITDVASTNDQIGPTLTKRLLRNTVIAENGRTIALGGLISTNIQDTITKVPLLGDIPILGWLFKRKDVIEKKTNLLIFITPHIIRTADDL